MFHFFIVFVYFNQAISQIYYLFNIKKIRPIILYSYYKSSPRFIFDATLCILKNC